MFAGSIKVSEKMKTWLRGEADVAWTIWPVVWTWTWKVPPEED